jgi:fucose permease
MVDLSGCLLSVGIILLWQDSEAALWAGAFGLGLFMASIFPTVLLWAERRIVLSGSVMRWFFVGASMGGMVFPWLAGQFFDRSGPQVTMVIVFGLLLANVGLFWLLMSFGGKPREAED